MKIVMNSWSERYVAKSDCRLPWKWSHQVLIC